MYRGTTPTIRWYIKTDELKFEDIKVHNDLLQKNNFYIKLIFYILIILAIFQLFNYFINYFLF